MGKHRVQHESLASIRFAEGKAEANLRTDFKDDHPTKRKRHRIWDKPELVEMAHNLMRRGHSQSSAAQEMGISVNTVKKMIVPGFAEKEDLRLQEQGKQRAPARRLDPKYIDYQNNYNLSETHKKDAREYQYNKRRDAGKPVQKNYGGHWKTEEISLLGTMTDKQVANKTGRTISAVRNYRHSHKISAYI